MNKATGVTRIIKATGYSLKGLKQAWQHEAAFRQELMLLVVACWLPVSLLERLLLIGVVVLMELLNSAIEAVVDRVGTDYHELSGRAKDRYWIGCGVCGLGLCGRCLGKHSVASGTGMISA